MDTVLVLLVLLFGAAEGTSEPVAVLHPMPVDDSGVLEAAQAAEKSFNNGSRHQFYTKLSKVISAEVQVVEGLLYHLTLELRTSVCRKDAPDLQNCPFHQDPQYAARHTCRYRVWYRPWLGPVQVHGVSCRGVAK